MKAKEAVLQPTPATESDASPRTSQAASLVCVSHREPFASRNHKLERTTGGLVTALDSALRELGGAWVACGKDATTLHAPEDEDGRSYEIRHLGLSPRTQRAYYGGFSNQVLWPLFHYFIGRVHFDSSEWSAYERANERFARAVTNTLSESSHPSPVAWIHDYHLMRVPKFVRDLAPDASIGFFLHIPFPTWEVFRVLPTHMEILEGLLGADLVGFHAPSYRDAFLECCRHLPGAEVDGTCVHFEGRRIQATSSPIGIDISKQRALAERPGTLARAARLKKNIGAERIVLGVDRLDYSKGIVERLRGFERLLERYPEHQRNVTLVQIAVPSRTQVDDYRRLKRACDEEVGRINGRFSGARWNPIRYLTRSFSQEELVAWYRAGDVALVTPLRDGLNLVAKEYIASRTDDSGALVLSEFAGAAQELEDAWFVNPFSADSLADGLHHALTDNAEDARRRMSRLASQVGDNDVNDWARRFVDEIGRAHQRGLGTRH